MVVDICGVAEKTRTRDLTVIGSRPPLAIRQIRCVQLVNRTNNITVAEAYIIFEWSTNDPSPPPSPTPSTY